MIDIGVLTRIARHIKKHKRGLNDKLYLFNILFTSAYTVSVFWLTLNLNIDHDISSYASLAPYIYGELGLHTGFWVWKCKTENCRKYKDINQLTQLESEVDSHEIFN